MTPRTKLIYKGAIKNNNFLKAIKEANNDKKPSIIADKTEKILFATIYYGWLVAKYGKDWELNL